MRPDARQNRTRAAGNADLSSAHVRAVLSNQDDEGLSGENGVSETMTDIDHDLECVRHVIIDALRQTSLREQVDRFESTVSGGKMLRARLALTLGQGTTVSRDALYRLGAAIELLHAGSLLHDDIIDGGVERRSAAALWVSEGTKAAVLIGDLLLSVSLRMVQEAGPERLPLLIQTLSDMCDAEAEQEFSSDSDHDSWEGCVRIARRKTGALFGFSAACAAGPDAALALALERAGSDLGTAYQLADDMLDTCADPSLVDKSLGTDAAAGKLTAATASAAVGIDPDTAIDELLLSAEGELTAWSPVQQHWDLYVDDVIRPLVRKFTRLAKVEAI